MPAGFTSAALNGSSKEIGAVLAGWTVLVASGLLSCWLTSIRVRSSLAAAERLLPSGTETWPVTWFAWAGVWAALPPSAPPSDDWEELPQPARARAATDISDQTRRRMGNLYRYVRASARTNRRPTRLDSTRGKLSA